MTFARFNGPIFQQGGEEPQVFGDIIFPLGVALHFNGLATFDNAIPVVGDVLYAQQDVIGDAMPADDEVLYSQEAPGGDAVPFSEEVVITNT